ncbi:S-layer homology domain-containing protein [uncultured Agathobaculum sp.]|uniref:S-layer homology domain-containing protein n=1 Tax=uncultured Agathobaculum sp. TaxID=2048140 RepID=UPI00296FB06D
MFAGAASYSDKADIKASTAVDMLSSLGVIQGYDDGSFKPDTTVTRAQMAKMIFTIMNGGNDNADAYVSLPTKFTDLPTAAWAQGYVRYLQNTGIIAGKSATEFAPNKTVTGLEAAKMVLVAAGYNAEKAGLTGAAWAQNTMKYGQLNNLFEDVNTNLNAALPRQYAAQILYNALDMERVVWSNDIEDFKPATDISDDRTIGGKYMDLVKTKAAQLTKVEKTSGKDTYEITVGGDSYDKVPTDVSDLIGLNVKVLKKVKSNGDVDVYGVYADDDSKVLATGTVGTLDTVKNESKKFKVDGTEYKADSALTATRVIYPNEESVPSAVDTLGEVISNKDTYPAYSIKAVDLNGNNKADLVVVVPTDVKEVTYVGSSAATIGGKSYKFDDVDIYDGVKKDDWAVIVSGDYTSSGDPIITKATVVSGTVEGVKSGSPAEIKIGGNWYKATSSVSMPSVDDEVDATVVGNYVYNVDTTGTSSKNVLFISGNKEAESNLSKDYTAEARAYFTDGSNKKIVVDKLNGKDITDHTGNNSASVTKVTVDTLANRLYTYTTDKDGNYELKEIAASATTSTLNNAININKNMAGYDKYNVGGFHYDKSNGTTNGTKDTSFYEKRLNGTLIADDAVVFVVANNEIKVVSGKSARDWSNGLVVTNYGFLTKESNGIDYAKVAAVAASNNNGDAPNADGDKLYAYVTADSFETKKDGDTVTAFNVIVGGSTEATTLYEDGTSNTGVAAGSVIAYTVDGDEIEVKGIITDANYSYLNSGAFAIKGFDGKKKGDMSLVDKNGAIVNATLDEDCVFIGVDDAKNVGTVSEIGAVPTSADKDEFDRYTMNAYVVFNTDGKIAAVVYDTVNNELDITPVKTASTAAAVTVTAPNAINAAAPAGAYNFQLNNNSAKPGSTVQLTITCATAPTAGKDTVTIKNGSTVVGSATFNAAGTAVITVTVVNGTNTLTATVANA